MAFLAYLLKVLAPLRLSTYRLSIDTGVGVGRAAAWASVVGLAPAFVMAPSPDPGVLFGIMAGVALAWRRTAEKPVEADVEIFEAVAAGRARSGALRPARFAPGIIERSSALRE
ncbi:MAG: hypothetical protein WDN76_05515 [Alphaproteobacteria bacterium]